MKVTALDLRNLNICDHIIEEPLGGVHHDFESTANKVKEYILNTLKELCNMTTEELIDSRIEKYDKIGAWTEID